jgi:putative ABC transport system permease protein
MSSIAGDLIWDFSYGWRQLRKNPSFALLSIAVLAMGIGAATSVFAVLYAVLLKPLPYREAARIVYVHNEFPASPLGRTAASAPDYADLTAHQEIFSETAAYYFNDFTMTGVRGSGYAEHVDAVNASATLFSLLGIRPQLGRTMLASDDQYGAPAVAVLSDALWRSKFGANTAMVGKTIELNGEPYQIIGVMPADFDFPYSATEMWVPLVLRPEEYAEGERGDKWLQMLGRLAPGVDLEAANSILAAVSHRVAAQHPGDYPEKSGWHFSIEPMLAEQTREVRKWLLLAFGAVVCVLLIACTNVSGLLLVRATVRQREWAVRSALGASAGRLIRQILLETGTLAGMGCAAGVGLAIALVRLVNTYGPIHGHHAEVESWALAFALGLCLICTLISGAVPALLSSRVPLDQSLRGGAGRTSTGQSRWRGVLVAGQISIAIALLFTAAALSRSFARLLEVSPGFSPERVWSACITLPQKHYTTATSHAEFFRTLVDRIAAMPGVRSASAALALPFSYGGYTADLYFPDRPEARVRPAARVNVVLPRYFETLHIPLLEGRTFTAQDTAGARSVVVVDEQFVRNYFPGQDPIGKLLANNCCHKDTAAIIGVVGNVATRELGAAPSAQIYWPQLQLPSSAMFLAVRQAGQADVTSAVRELLDRQDPAVALFDIETMPDRIMDSVKLRRFVAWLLTSFALMGMILAALGLYGTLAYLVQLRQREIAIRLAFGATAADIATLVARSSASLAMKGLLPGILLCAVALRATRSLLFGVAPLDLWTLASTAAGLFLVVIISTWSPLAKAAGVSALSMLRDE